MAWFDTNWNYRFKITSDNTKVDEAIGGLCFDLNNAPSEFWNNVQSNGADIRITQSDGTTQRARDVPMIDTGNNQGIVRIDTSNISPSSNTDYYIYYGNSGVSEPGVSDTYGQYNAYEEEIHTLGDGTSNDRVGNASSPSETDMSYVSGLFGLDAGSFNGSSSEIDYGTNDGEFSSGEDFYITVWFKTTGTSNAGMYVKGYDDSETTPWYLSRVPRNGVNRCYLRDSGSTDFNANNDDTWIDTS